MHPASEQHIPDGLLAASVLLNEKPRQGFETENPAPHQSLNRANCTAALGLSWGVVSETRSTHVMGRFMSPDWAKTPEGVPYADLSNPQSLNLYGYVNNNPLSHTDSDGHQCNWCNTVISWLSSSHSSNASANGSLGQGSASNGSLSASASAVTGSASASASYGLNTSAGANVSGSVASATVNEGANSTTQMNGLTANAGANAGVSLGGGNGVQASAGGSANADVLTASQTEKITIGPITITGTATGAVGIGANASASVGTNGVSASAGVTPGAGGSVSLSVTWGGVSASGGASSTSNFNGTTNKVNQPVIKPQQQ